MRAKRNETEPKFPVWSRVVFSYSTWECPWDHWDLAATVAATERWDHPEGRYCLLKLDDPGELDKIDREALEGPDRNLYGWVLESSLKAERG